MVHQKPLEFVSNNGAFEYLTFTAIGFSEHVDHLFTLSYRCAISRHAYFN